MPDQTLNDFFAGPVMTELAQSPTIRRGVERFAPAQLWTPSAVKPVSTQVKYKKFNGNRAAAQIVHHGSPSKQQEVPGSQWQYVTALGSRENFTIDQEMLYALKSNIPYIQAQAQAEFKKRIGDFQERMDALRTAVVCSAISLGKIYYDSSGNILTSSSGAVNTIDFSTTSFATGDTITNGGTTVGDWSSASTDIPGKVRAMTDGFYKTTGYKPKYALYGQNFPSYMGSTNTSMQAYWSRNQVLGQQFLNTNEVPNNFGDLVWIPAHKNIFVASDNSTISTWWATNQLTLLPDFDDTWYEFFEAGTAVPTGLAAPSQSLETLLGSIQIVNGKFGYVEMSTDPIKLKAISGDYFLPTIKNGSVVWNITVQ